MPKPKSLWIWIVTLIVILVHTAVALADVLVLCLDISLSMKTGNKFEAAKTVLIQQIEEARPGDVVYVVPFDSNDHPLGRLEVGEDGSQEAKAQLITKVRSFRAKGQWTNIDEPLQAAKALLLEERIPGARKIVILSDGLSDPSPDHTRIDIQDIGQMIPQELGWSVYLVGLPADIAGLFQVQPQEMTEIVLAPEAPQIKGIALQQFSREKIGEAVRVVKEDVAPAPVTPSESTQETLEASSQSIPGSTTPTVFEQAPPAVVPASKPFPLSWLLGTTLLAVLGMVLLILPRRASSPQNTAFTLEVREREEDNKQLSFTFSEGAKITVGPKGDVPLSDPELPAVVCTFHWSKGQLFLTPRDTLTINGQPVTVKTPVGVGDRITVREKTTITINEGDVSL